MPGANLTLFGIFLIYSTVFTISFLFKELSNVNFGYGPKLLHLVMSFQHSEVLRIMDWSGQISLLLAPHVFQAASYNPYRRNMLLKAFFFPIQTQPLSEDFSPTKHKHIQTQIHVTCTAQYFNLQNDSKERQTINELPRKNIQMNQPNKNLLSFLCTIFWYYILINSCDFFFF